MLTFKFTKLNYMANETKNPIFWAFILFLVGIGLGIWGMVKEDCIGGPGCWAGSGFLKWAGGIMIALGLLGFFTIKGKGK